MIGESTTGESSSQQGFFDITLPLEKNSTLFFINKAFFVIEVEVSKAMND